MEKNNKIPPFIICPTPELARQVLEKIEREIKLMPSNYFKGSGSEYLSERMFYDMYPLVIVTNNGEFLSFKKLEPNNTNFTKAEDFLNNYMTEKTWDNLEVNDVLIDGAGKARTVLGVCGRIVFISTADSHFIASHAVFSAEELIKDGYKIKGASEDKPDLDAVIIWLEKVKSTAITSERTDIADTAIEMLKKLK